MNQAPLPNKKIILTLSVVALVVLSALIYFFAWRPSDKEYQALSSNLNTLTATQSEINKDIKKIQTPSGLTKEIVSSLENNAKRYTDALSVALSNGASSKDTRVKNTLGSNKTQLSAYGESANDLAGSLKQYRLIAGWCGEAIRQTTPTMTLLDFNAAADGCEGALDNAKTASYVAFNDQFLGKYTELYNKLLDAYRQELGRTNATPNNFSYKNIDPIVKELGTLYESPLDLAIAIDITSPLKVLSETVSSQKSAVIR